MSIILSVALWLCIYLLFVLAPPLILMLGEVPPGSGFWWDFSMALGFSAMAMMGVQFLLTARFRRASAPFGIDILYYFHRYLALIVLGMISLHYILIRINHADLLAVANPLSAPWYMTSGRVAFVLIAMLVITSLWRKRLRIHYDEWRLLHIGMATTGFFLALGHIEGVGYYIDAPAKRLLWTGYTLFWLCLIIYLRLIKPWRIRRRPYQVVDVRQERGNSWTLALEAKGHKGLSFRPGQFAWLTLRNSPWHIKEHPFSFSSSAVDKSRLEFTIKELGDFTRTIKNIHIGETAYLDGPYGSFSVDRYPEVSGFVFIAGGVGVAPIISMLRTLADRHEQRPIWFIYSNNNWQDVIFREELEVLQQKLNLNLVHVLLEPPPDWRGETGFVTQQLLQKVLPDDVQNYEHFLCGPKPMSEIVQQGLRELKVPLCRIHFELFDMV